MIERQEPKKYGGSLSNFLVQMRSASLQAARDWQRYIDAGYVEVAPGILRSPDGNTEVSH